MCLNSSLKSLSQLKTKFTWDHHGIGQKIYSNDSGQLLFFILILPAPVGGGGGGGGAFSIDFTTNLARHCRAFSRALKIEKLKAPLYRGPKGAGATNDWCINKTFYYAMTSVYDFWVVQANFQEEIYGINVSSVVPDEMAKLSYLELQCLPYSL